MEITALALAVVLAVVVTALLFKMRDMGSEIDDLRRRVNEERDIAWKNRTTLRDDLNKDVRDIETKQAGTNKYLSDTMWRTHRLLVDLAEKIGYTQIMQEPQSWAKKPKPVR